MARRFCRIGKVVFTARSSGGQQQLIDVAAKLALEYRAELSGLFLRDPDILHYAALPFSRRVTSASFEVLEPAMMERALARQAEELQRALAAAADPLRLAWSFQIVSEAIDEALGSRLLAANQISVLEDEGAGGGRRALLRRIAERPSTASVLLLSPAGRLAGPVTAVFAGETAVLERAVRLARALGLPLLVLAASPDCEAGAAAWLRRRRIAAGVRRLGADTPRAEIMSAHPGVLVAGRSDRLPDGAPVGALLEDLPVPLFLVGG